MISKLKYTALSLLIIFAYSAAHAVINGANVTLTASTLCNNGSIEKRFTGGCPSGYSAGALVVTPPAPTNSFEWTLSFEAAEATGTGIRFDVGGGNNDGTNLADVPWGSLTPGSAVNIYYRDEPYREKVIVTETGTAANPIKITGVTDPQGRFPIIDGDGATTLNFNYYSTNVQALALFESLMILYRKHIDAGGVYGQTADYIEVRGLHFRNARPEHTYTRNGVTYNYEHFARGVWNYANENNIIEGNIFENLGEGIFAGSPAEKSSKHITIRGNWFKDNGYYPTEPGQFASHQIYAVANADPDKYNIVEGNIFDEIGHTDVAQLKVRSVGAIVRYNLFRKGARTLDIVEAQDTLVADIFDNYTPQEILDKYRSSYVYGNTFIIDESLDPTGFTYPFHFGWDSNEYYAANSGSATAIDEPTGRGVGAPTYFYNNTVYMNVPATALWRGGLFDVDGANASPYTGEVIAHNNVIAFAPTSDARFGQLRYTGQLTWTGANLVYSAPTAILAESDNYASNENAGDDPAVTIINNDTRITTDPAFVDPDNANWLARDYSLDTGSPAIGAGTALPAPMSSLPPLRMPVNPATGLMPARSTLNNLGAYE